MRKYRGAILGCGGRGDSQATAYSVHPHVSLVALCDIDESRLKAAGEKHRVKALYADFVLGNSMLRTYSESLLVESSLSGDNWRDGKTKSSVVSCGATPLLI